MVVLTSCFSIFRNFIKGRYDLRPGETLFRHCIFPLAFGGKSAFRQDLFWKLYDGEPGVIEASVAWERFVPTFQYVHDYGCRLALKMNVTQQKKGKFSEKSRRVYCGAYITSVDAVRSLVGADNLPEITSADVLHKIEDGELAHAAVLIKVREDQSDIEGTK